MPFLIPPMLITGKLFKAWNSCSELYVYVVLVFEAMATFKGQVSVVSFIVLFGATTTAMVTTAWKAVTLLLSYLIFTKRLIEQHGTGLLLIEMEILLKMLPDQSPNPRPVELAAVQSQEHNRLQLETYQEEEEKRALKKACERIAKLKHLL